MTRKQLENAARLTIRTLRHNPELLNLTLDSRGYVEISVLQQALQCAGYPITSEELLHILSNIRYGFTENRKRVRADYGTSLGIPLSQMYESPDTPPEILYHGTSEDALDSIQHSGIIRFAKNGKKPRDHVFLTELPDVAVKKGNRYGEGISLKILARKMHDDGYLFYHAKHDIWLTDHIPPEYIVLEGNDKADPFHLQRFINAQNYHNTYETAKKELQNGSKETHWIWFIFPQCSGMGYSENSIYYSIKSTAEARAYMEHHLLRTRLLEICETLYQIDTDDIMSIMWEIDCFKVKSCVTLFHLIAPEYDIFKKILDKYFMSNMCYKTIQFVEG